MSYKDTEYDILDSKVTKFNLRHKQDKNVQIYSVKI